MVGLKRNLLNKAKINLASLGLIGFLSNCFFSCQNSQSQQNKKTQNLEDTINKNQNDNYLDTIKSADNLKKFDNWLSSVLSDEELKELKKPKIPNYLKDSAYKFSEEDLKKFNSLIDSTLNESKRENKNAILINKSEYALYLIKSGELYSKYPIELGENPYDAKQKEGDSCTPEGMYKVSKKLDKEQTTFYRAFLLDYPNAEDRKNKKTGSAIEIHGSGSGSPPKYGGSNWTWGCISLSNDDIDEIFSDITKGNRITIVKYTNKDLDDLLFKYPESKRNKKH